MSAQVSMPIVGGHRNGGKLNQQQERKEGRAVEDVDREEVAGETRPTSTLTTTALFIQAPSRSFTNRSSNSASASGANGDVSKRRGHPDDLADGGGGEDPHLPVEEDQTIVIDLTEERYNLERTHDELDDLVTLTRLENNAHPDEVEAGRRPFSHLSSTSSSLDVHPPGEDSDGHYFLHVLNGRGEVEQLKHVLPQDVPSWSEKMKQDRNGDASHHHHMSAAPSAKSSKSVASSRRGGKGPDEAENKKKVKSQDQSISGRLSLAEEAGKEPKIENDENGGYGYDDTEDEEEEEEDKNHSHSLPTERFVGEDVESAITTEPEEEEKTASTSTNEERQQRSLHRPRQLNLLNSHKAQSTDMMTVPAKFSSSPAAASSTAATTTSTLPSMRNHQNHARSSSLKRDLPLSLFGGAGTQGLAEASPISLKGRNLTTYSSVRDGSRGSLDRRSRSKDGKTLIAVGRKSQSNDFLDRMDFSSSGGGTLSSRGKSATLDRRRARSRAKMNKIEKKLYLGNMEAATDVILLESHEITHIITLDSVPLPRKVTTFLPKIRNLHIQVTDLPDEDILSYVTQAVAFINEGMSGEGAVLVHCFRGKSRSAAIVTAYLMQKYNYTLEKAIKKVRAKRECINPHEGFLAQLKLYESMDYHLDTSNVQFKMFKLHLASERMRKAKILFRDSLDNVLDEDAGGDTPLDPLSSAGSARGQFSQTYKCKRCRRLLATSHNMIPHVTKEVPSWYDPKWSLPAEEVFEGASDLGLELCPQSLFINPIRWMQAEIKQNLSGRLYCPNCQTKVGQYSWVKGCQCAGCKVTLVPAFQLDVTEIIFKTKNRFLQNTGREPIVV